MKASLLHRNHLLTRFLVTVLATGFPVWSFSQAGLPDTSFSADGQLATTIGSLGEWAQAVVVQSDDKIVVGGYSQTSFTTHDFALVRYLPNGDRDPAFGIDGKVTTPIETRSMGNALALQSDGKIVMAGASSWYLNLARYNSDGSLDTSFGSGGIVVTDVEGYYSEQCRAVRILDDGKILVGGYGQHFSNDNSYFLAVRYHADGSVDSTFATNGTLIGGQGRAHAMGIQSDGKIVLGGQMNMAFAMERYDSNGTPDLSFGVNGTVFTPVTGYSEARALVIQPDGNIVLAGTAVTGFDSSYFALVRYDASGTPDNSFGQGGIVVAPIGDYTFSYGMATQLQSDGKLLLAGFAKDSLDLRHFALARYTTDGDFDNTFGSGGTMITPFGTSNSIPNALAIQNDGRIVLAGQVFDSNNVDIALARYLGDAGAGLDQTAFDPLIRNVYPNPSAGSFTIAFNRTLEGGTLRIYATDGRLVHTDNVSGNEIQVSGHTLPCGTYAIQLLERGSVIGRERLVITGF